jgi:predicted anti-sigma-YlaC factor YlaD
MVSCRDMTELSTDYLERTLGWRARLRVRRHLAYCSMCRAYFDQVQKTLRLLRGRPLDGPGEAAEARILDARPPAPGSGGGD